MSRTIRFALIALAIGIVPFAVAVPARAHAGEARDSRTYPWNSGHVTLDIPAHVVFHSGLTWRMTISAPAHTLSQLIVDNGHIKARRHVCFSLDPLCIGYGETVKGPVHVNLTGPALRRIQVDGPAQVRLEQLRQQRLAVKINGVGSVRGTGSVTDLVVVINGSGHIHFARMIDQQARVDINGVGTVAIAPTVRVSVHINGVGNVQLHSNPAHVSSHINGVGHVTRVPST